MVVSLPGVNFTSQQGVSTFQMMKHWLKVSEHIFEMLYSIVGMLLVSFAPLVITNLAVILTCSQSVVLAYL